MPRLTLTAPCVGALTSRIAGSGPEVQSGLMLV
jgi:hypothetical protein